MLLTHHVHQACSKPVLTREGLTSQNTKAATVVCTQQINLDNDFNRLRRDTTTNAWEKLHLFPPKDECVLSGRLAPLVRAAILSVEKGAENVCRGDKSQRFAGAAGICDGGACGWCRVPEPGPEGRVITILPLLPPRSLGSHLYTVLDLFGAIPSAAQAFQALPGPDAVRWTTLILTVARVHLLFSLLLRTALCLLPLFTVW